MRHDATLGISGDQPAVESGEKGVLCRRRGELPFAYLRQQHFQIARPVEIFTGECHNLDSAAMQTGRIAG